MDDRTVGLVLRALRRRRGWRQGDLAERAGCSQAFVSAVERGHLAGTSVTRLRNVFGALDARPLVEPRWRGAELDRLLDADHAAIVEALARRLERDGWEPTIEVTYAVAGERGSIDVLGLNPARRAVLVAEVKSDIAATETVGRKLDEKGRLAAGIVRERFGWTPSHIATVLVLPESPRLRRLLTGPAASLARMFPIDSRLAASWLQRPAGRLAATWFLSNIAPPAILDESGGSIAVARSPTGRRIGWSRAWIERGWTRHGGSCADASRPRSRGLLDVGWRRRTGGYQRPG